MLSIEHFYQDIKPFKHFSDFTELKRYKPLPSDWFVVITDIEGSTAAIENGKYKEINSVSTASMVAVINVFEPLELPYVFGGDGATLCIPPSKLEAVKGALAASRELASKSFGFNLRVGLVEVATIEKNNHKVLVAKYQPNKHFKQAMFQGEGLSFAEKLVKDKEDNNPYLLKKDVMSEGNFDGFECRWNEISGSHEETIALMVKSLDETVKEQSKMYLNILKKIDDIYGGEVSFHPLREKDMSLTLSLKKLRIETKIRNTLKSKFEQLRYLSKLVFLAFAGKYLMSKGVKNEQVDWGQYKQNSIANTDFRKFDEILRMVIGGSIEQRQALIHYLTQLNEDKKIVFGVHDAPSSIVTCMIKDYDKNHTHFLDVSNGGYAMAAKQMKKQISLLTL